MRPDAGRGTGSGIIQTGELGSPAFYCVPVFGLIRLSSGGPHGCRLPEKADAAVLSHSIGEVEDGHI